MKTIFPTILICTLLALVFFAPAAFAVPQVINYQGELSDSSGPLNGDVNVVFTVYNAPSGGDVLWSEPRTVTVTDGVFNVLLGTQTPFPPDLFSGDDRYLGVKVEADDEMSPRQRLSSVPYSFASEKAGCYPGDSIHCYTGPPGTMNVGVCAPGLRNCNADGVGFAPDCVGDVLPQAEVCDTLDNNCSGEADEAGCADCVYTPSLCDDGVSCTDDACDPFTGCSHTPNNSHCQNYPVCVSATCHPVNDCFLVPMDFICDDGYACTADSCDVVDGCINAPMDSLCDDGNICTIDACNPGLGDANGCLYTPVDCDDGVACTDDSCDPFSGCSNAANNSYCDDGNECTIDSCNPGSGDPGTGCEYFPEQMGTLCTGGTCDDTGICIPN